MPEIGVSMDTLLTRAEKKVSSQRAGQMALTATRQEMAHDDAHLEDAWRNARTMAGRGTEAGLQTTYQQTMETLVSAQKKAADTARRFVDSAIDDINKDTSKTLKEIKTDEHPGALWRKVGAQFQGYNTAIRTRAKVFYDTADAAGGAADMPDSGTILGNAAQDFLDRVPEVVRNKYPMDIRSIAKLAGRAADPEKN